MNKRLAASYAEQDNELNAYFDRVLLDLVTPEFRREYYLLRLQILQEIFRDLKCDPSIAADSPAYVMNPAYDDLMIRLLEHYYTVFRCSRKAVYETELMMIEHYLALCGYAKDPEGYWIIEEEKDVCRS